MKERYQETFDQVRASDSLRKKIGDIPALKRKKSRRGIPKAILIAAVLTAFLAGTAVAGSFNWIVLEPVENFTNSGETAYHLNGNAELLPLEYLPQELLDRAEPQSESWDEYGFDSWSEAEKFLGLELADNPRLEQMRCRKLLHTFPNGVEAGARCLLSVSYLYNSGLPGSLEVHTSYEEDGFLFGVHALLYTQANPNADMLGFYLHPHEGETMEDYVTPSGLSATIFTDPYPAWGTNYTTISAYFVKGNATFQVMTSVSKGDNWTPPKDPDKAMALLKEILDGFQ